MAGRQDRSQAEVGRRSWVEAARGVRPCRRLLTWLQEESRRYSEAPRWLTVYLRLRTSLLPFAASPSFAQPATVPGPGAMTRRGAAGRADAQISRIYCEMREICASAHWSLMEVVHDQSDIWRIHPRVRALPRNGAPRGRRHHQPRVRRRGADRGGRLCAAASFAMCICGGAKRARAARKEARIALA